MGNQLFQLAAGYSIQAGREIVCEVGFSGPRKNLRKKSVLSDLSLDQRVTLTSSKKLKRTTQAFLDYSLRVSTKTTGIESLLGYRAIVSLFGSLYFSFYYKCFLLLSLSKGIGFHDLPKYRTNQMIIGYFQSYRYLKENDKKTFFNMLSLKEHGPDWDYWSKLAIRERPLIVHIRLGDYLSEKSFGIVTDGYISESLSLLEASTVGRPIWVFSDQPNFAVSIFPPGFSEKVVWVPEIDSSPMATLALMRLGSGYVIANSTFSWWAAWSKQYLAAPVFCPRPWFVRFETPRELIPTDWIQIDTDHKEHK